jgi:hypothetical protein
LNSTGADVPDDSINHPENPYQSSAVQDDVVRHDFVSSDTDLSETAKILRQTRPWVLLIGIFGMLVSALFVVGLLVSSFSGGGGPAPVGVAELLLLIVCGSLYVMPLFMVLRFAHYISRFVAQPNMEHLLSTLGALRTFWRLTGGIVLAVMGLYVLLIMGSVL